MTVFEILRDELLKSLEGAERHLASGKPSNYADYREVVGMIRAYNHTLNTVNQLEKHQLEIDDE